jgi:hypothetical protein
MPRAIELDPGEVERFLKLAITPRQELVCRLALRSLSPRLYSDFQFRQRVQELLRAVPDADISAVLGDAARLEAQLLCSRDR